MQTKGKIKIKYTWHVKWRRYNPISWILCWLFEQNVALMPEWFFYLHDWFCPEVREAEEENKGWKLYSHFYSGTSTNLK